MIDLEDKCLSAQRSGQYAQMNIDQPAQQYISHSNYHKDFWLCVKKNILLVSKEKCGEYDISLPTNGTRITRAKCAEYHLVMHFITQVAQAEEPTVKAVSVEKLSK